MLERAKENGVLLTGPEAGVGQIEEIIKDQIDVSIEEFWETGGSIGIELDSCDCKIDYRSREEFPTEDTECDCGKNMFVKYNKDTTVIDINKLKEQQGYGN